MTDRPRPTAATPVLKITTTAAWSAAIREGTLAPSADDLRDGFIHLSTADQATGTARRYFMGRTDLIIAAWRCGDLGDALRWEPSRGGDFFPHYYGRLPVASRLWARPLPLRDDGVPDIVGAIGEGSNR